MEETNPNYVQPDLNTFRDDLKDIYAEGDTEKAWQRLCYYLQHMQFEGKWLTYDWIMFKFKQHIEWWDQSFGVRDPKYLSAKDREKRKNFYEFLGQEIYKNDYSVKISKLRDKYLFPEKYTTKQLKERFERFKSKYL